MTKDAQLTKTCLSCSEEKSISAFLQLSGAKSTTYGNICSNCRSLNTQTTTSFDEVEVEDATGTSSTGLKIDTKTKVQTEKNNKQRAKHNKEVDLKERKKRTKSLLDKVLLTKQTIEAEQKHREDYIDPKKKAGYLGYSNKTTLRQKNPATRQNFVDTLSTQNHEQNIQNKQGTEVKQQQDKAAKHEQALSTIDFTVSYDAPHTALEKYKGSVFTQFKLWLGSGAAINLTEQKSPEKNIQASQNQTTPAKENNKEKNPSIEHADKAWKPSSRR